MLGAVALGEPGQLDGSSFTAASVSAWLYLVVAGSLVGFSAYAWLLRVAPISLVVTHQYVNPLVAIALGMLLLGERPSPWTLAGAFVVVGRRPRVATACGAIPAESPSDGPAATAPTSPRRARLAGTRSGPFRVYRDRSPRAESGLRRGQSPSTCDRRAARNSSRSDRVRIPEGLPSLTTTTAPEPPESPS